MNIPENLWHKANEILNMEADRADKTRLWAVLLKLTPKKDGDQWFVLLGENLQEGIVGFGDSPVDAIQAFEHEMYKSLKAKP